MVRTAGFTLGSRLLTALLQFGVVLLLSHELGPAGRGICGFYLVVITLGNIIGDLAGGAATAWLVQQGSARQILRVHRWWSIVPSVVVSACLFALAKVDLLEAGLLGAASWANGVFVMQQQVWLGWQRYRYFNGFNLLVPVLCLVFFIAMGAFFTPLQPVHYLWSLLAGWLSLFFINYTLQQRQRYRGGSSQRRQPLSTIFGKGISNQLGHLAGLGNTKLLFFLWPATGLGVYANALTLTEASLLVPGSLGQVLYSMVSRQPGSPEKYRWLRVAWWASLAMMAGVVAFVVLCPDGFWQALFGARFQGMRPIFRILAPGLWLYGLYLVLTYWQSSHGRFMINFYAQLAGLAANAAWCGWHLWQNSFSVTQGAVGLTIGWATVALAAALFYLNTGGQVAVITRPPSWAAFIQWIKRIR